MEKLETTEIHHIGQQQVENWLIDNGFINVVQNDKTQEAMHDIEANGSIENILVHIRVALHPDLPNKTKADEKATIRTSAEKLNRKAYVAYVVIDPDKNVVGEINWERLG